jgi:hypothetical protein
MDLGSRSLKDFNSVKGVSQCACRLTAISTHQLDQELKDMDQHKTHVVKLTLMQDMPLGEELNSEDSLNAVRLGTGEDHRMMTAVTATTTAVAKDQDVALEEEVSEVDQEDRPEDHLAQ